MIEFIPAAVEDVDDHIFGIYDCSSSLDDIAGELAEQVEELYVEPSRLAAVLQAACEGLDRVADPSFVQGLVDDVRRDAIPEPFGRPDRPPQFDVARNELAEVIALLAARGVAGAEIPDPRVRTKEVKGQPTRGIDLIGLVGEEQVSLVVAEVKASSEVKSPPGVVDTGDDCLRAQLSAIVPNAERIREELNRSIKLAQDEVLRLKAARALIQLATQSLPVVAFPVLVRPRDVCDQEDFGELRSSPEQLEPAVIHFCVVRIPDDLEDLATRVYQQARGVT